MLLTLLCESEKRLGLTYKFILLYYEEERFGGGIHTTERQRIA